MARRGTPIPMLDREAVKQRRLQGESLRAIAKALQLAVNTVRKYARKIDTESLHAKRLVA